MSKSLKIRTIVLWIFSFFFLLLCVWYLIKYKNKDVGENWSDKAFYLSISSLIINSVFLLYYKVKIYSFQAVIIFLTYLFMFGRVWLNHLGLDGEIYWPLHKMYNENLLQTASLLAVCCTHALFLGMMIVYNKKGTSRERRIDNGTLFNLGILLILISLPCRLITDFRSVSATASTKSFTSLSASVGLIDDIAYLLVPGILCIMESKPKLRKPLFFVLGFYYVIIMAVTGDRRYYVSAILALGAYVLPKRSKSSQKIKKRNLILAFVLSIVFLNFLEIVRKIRSGNLSSFGDFVSNYGVDVFVVKDIIYDVAVEFGISFFSVASIIYCIPQVYPYQFGSTLVKTIPSVLPAGFAFGNMFSEASPSTYINKYMDKPVGATMFGDLYANFGNFCILAVFISGIIIGLFFVKEKTNVSGYTCVMYYTRFYILINLVRCSIIEVFRPIVWCTVIPYCLLLLLNRKRSIKE